MMAMMGSRNTRGFTSSVNSGILPPPSHITYEGIFNELKFNVGAKSEKLVDVHMGYARYQFTDSLYDSSIHDYLALFLKSKKDGAERDQRPINATIVLDISGSMGSGLQQRNKSNEHKSRLSLSIEAIKMLISKLRPDDSIGMVIFDTKGDVTLQQQFKKNIKTEEVFEDLDRITTRGGTTILAGFQPAQDMLSDFVKKNQLINCENRIIMLTDVGDNSLTTENKFVEMASQSGIHITIIGISDSFRSETCEKLKNVEGFNYFCAVDQDDIKKYVFETFDFGFFSAAYDVNMDISSPDIKGFEVFGSSDSELVLGYNDGFKQPRTTWKVTSMKTIFPSEIEIVHDKVLTVGGLILIKLDRKSSQPFIKGEIQLQYSDYKREKFEETFKFSYEFPPNEQFFSEGCLTSAIEGFTFASEMKKILGEASKLERKEREKYLEPLRKLKEIAPESKLKDIESVLKIIEEEQKKIENESAKEIV